MVFSFSRMKNVAPSFYEGESKIPFVGSQCRRYPDEIRSTCLRVARPMAGREQAKSKRRNNSEILNKNI
jgi:hypothetical protein